MRRLAVLSLIGLLAFCPSVCGAAEADHGAHGHEHPEGSPRDHHHAPAHCPDGGGSCICNGAVQSAEVRVDDSKGGGHVLPPRGHSADPGPTLTHAATHLTPGGTPSGLAGWGDRGAVLALLQNFRC